MIRHRYTQEEFDALPVNGAGGKICPMGDYSDIAKIPDYSELGNWCELGDRCKLGVGCELGYGCKLGNWCKLGEKITFEGGCVVHGHYLTCGNIGSRKDTAYFYIDKDGKFFVRAGCWFSEMEAFLERVREAHGESLYAQEYRLACEFACKALILKKEEQA